MIRAVHIQCGFCHRVKVYVAQLDEMNLEERLKSAQVRMRCTSCGLRRARVSIKWHKWPEEKWLNEAPDLPSTLTDPNTSEGR